MYGLAAWDCCPAQVQVVWGSAGLLRRIVQHWRNNPRSEPGNATDAFSLPALALSALSTPNSMIEWSEYAAEGKQNPSRGHACMLLYDLDIVCSWPDVSSRPERTLSFRGMTRSCGLWRCLATGCSRPLPTKPSASGISPLAGTQCKEALHLIISCRTVFDVTTRPKQSKAKQSKAKLVLAWPGDIPQVACRRSSSDVRGPWVLFKTEAAPLAVQMDAGGM